MITEARIKELEFVKNLLLKDIEKTVAAADTIKDKLTSEVLISLTYLNMFSDHIKERPTFSTVEDGWKFMNDIKTVIEKVYYVSHYIVRFKESLEQKKA